jgi:anti-sigma factor RsiW
VAEAVIIEQCSECVALLGDYLDGALEKERAAALEQHLSRCMPCVTFVRTYKKSSVLAREKLATDMPKELVNALQSFLKGAIPGFTCDGKKGDCGGSPQKAEPKKS